MNLLTPKGYLARVLSPFIMAAALTLCPLQQSHADEWTGPDKTKHFAVSALIAAGAYAATESRNQAFLIALAPGLLKEVYDSTQPNNHFSGKDMVWNTLGAAVGVQIGYVIIKPNEVSVSFRF